MDISNFLSVGQDEIPHLVHGNIDHFIKAVFLKALEFAKRRLFPKKTTKIFWKKVLTYIDNYKFIHENNSTHKKKLDLKILKFYLNNENNDIPKTIRLKI